MKDLLQAHRYPSRYGKVHREPDEEEEIKIFRSKGISIWTQRMLNHLKSIGFTTCSRFLAKAKREGADYYYDLEGEGIPYGGVF